MQPNNYDHYVRLLKAIMFDQHQVGLVVKELFTMFGFPKKGENNFFLTKKKLSILFYIHAIKDVTIPSTNWYESHFWKLVC